MKALIVSGALAALATAPALAQPAGRRPATGCIDVSAASITVEGRLTRRIFPGPPNYEDVRRGDTPEPTYILALPRDICIDDNDDQADPNERFRTVHLHSNSSVLRRRLRAAIGRRVRITGDGFAALTGHHHAPLVVETRRVTFLSRWHR